MLCAIWSRKSFIQRIDHASLDLVLAQEFLVALIQLPERLVRTLPIDPELRREF